MDLQEVISVMREFDVDKVQGNIIYPSFEFRDRLGALADLSGQLGITHNTTPGAFTEDHYIYQSGRQGKDEYFLASRTVDLFESLMEDFKEINQVPPYFIMGSFQHTHIAFATKDPRDLENPYNYFVAQGLERMREKFLTAP